MAALVFNCRLLPGWFFGSNLLFPQDRTSGIHSWGCCGSRRSLRGKYASTRRQLLCQFLAKTHQNHGHFGPSSGALRHNSGCGTPGDQTLRVCPAQSLNCPAAGVPGVSECREITSCGCIMLHKLGVTVKHNDQLLPGNTVSATEQTISVTCDDAVPIGPGYGVSIPGIRRHIGEGRGFTVSGGRARRRYSTAASMARLISASGEKVVVLVPLNRPFL